MQQPNQPIISNDPELVALVVDDHSLFRLGIAAILKRQCSVAKVLEADSLDSGLKVLGDMPNLGLAVFDLAMPGMTSAASLRAVRETFPAVRLVVMTGSDNRQDILVALEAGVHGFIRKTLGAEEICGALLYVLRGQIYVPPELAVVPASSPVDVASTNSQEVSGDLGKLTLRQQEVLTLLRSGKSNKEIARAMHLSENTIKVHANAIYRALDVPNRRSLAFTDPRP